MIESPPTKALLRAIPDSYADALGQVPGAPPIDVARARAQHAAYAAALSALGLEVTVLPADEALPDCCFIEDTAVIAAGHALLTRPGAVSRRAEVDAVAAALDGAVTLQRTRVPALIDGGDVLRVAHTIYVGLSARTNGVSVGAVQEAFWPRGFIVRSVPVPFGTLHLKCHASSPVPGLVVVAEGSPLDGAFGPELRAVRVPRAEAYAANTVGVGETVLVAAGYPETAARLRAEGLEVVTLDMSELARADGSLTCLSLLY
ncbi:MAG: dimethylargininase [Deltaproteobacteria bacterium]|nr:MAG: dimethylargininase [Deltaproteobacteria bacterium]